MCWRILKIEILKVILSNLFFFFNKETKNKVKMACFNLPKVTQQAPSREASQILVSKP